MGRYLVMVDESMSFKDLSEMRVGDKFYETDMGMMCMSIVKTPVAKSLDEDGNNVIDFKADVYDFNFKINDWLEGSREVLYKSNEGFMIYGGRFYKDYCVWDREEQKVIE